MVRRGRRGVGRVEVLIAVAALLLLGGLLLPALNRARDGGKRVACADNLRQLALAAHKFHLANDTLPPYWGAYPLKESLSVKGSWFCHLLPYVGETTFYGQVMADIQQTGRNWDTAPPADAGRPARDGAGEGRPGAVLREVARYNGHRHYEWSSPDSDGGSGPAPAPPPPAASALGGVFRPEASARVFPLLRCPSDPSPGSYPDAGAGLVYLARGQSWGSTNYLANWHAFAGKNTASGYRAPPQKLGTVTKGLANTVLFAEGYAWCDGKGRLALNSWDYHSFGLTWGLDNAVVDDGTGARRVDSPDGMPNTYLFQVRPLPKDAPDCPDGSDCCDNWRAQTGHAALNAAMADCSVREFARGTTQRTWDQALLPRDDYSPGGEW